MTTAQAKAERRKFRYDTRYRPKHGGGMNKSQRRALARGRKRIAAGMMGGTIGGHSKGAAK